MSKYPGSMHRVSISWLQEAKVLCTSYSVFQGLGTDFRFHAIEFIQMLSDVILSSYALYIHVVKKNAFF